MAPQSNEEYFRVAFASYLRRHAGQWRLRRRDYLVPLDFHLARRQITLQGQIDGSTLQGFIDEQGDAVAVPRRLLDGDPTLIYLPFGLFPKQILLDFSTFAPDGTRLPLLTRAQGSMLTADHLYSLITKNRLAQLTDRRRIMSALLVLQVIAAVNPLSLEAEIERWVQRTWDRVKDPEKRYERWLRTQFEAFSPDLVGSTTNRLARRLKGMRTRNPILRLEPVGDEFEDLGRLTVLDSLTDLAAWGVREFLHILHDLPGGTTDSGRPNIPAVKRGLDKYLTRGVESLDYLMAELAAAAENDPRADAQLKATSRELLTSAISWMAYIVAPIRIDEPFHFRTTELLPLRQIEALRRRQPRRFLEIQRIRWETKHRYRVFPTDARACHVEVATEDPDLVIDHNESWVQIDGQYARAGELFHQEFQRSENIAHYYTSSFGFELPYRKTGGPIRLILRYKLPTAVFIAYAIAGFAVAADFAWGTYEWLYATPDQTTRLGLLTVGVGFLGLVLFFMSSRDTGPLVRGKVETLRFSVYVALSLLVVWPFIAFVNRIWK